MTMFLCLVRYLYNVLLAIACILDPRYKMQFVEFCYHGLYGHNSTELKNVKDKLFCLFNEYLSIMDGDRRRNLKKSSKEETSCVYDDTFDQDCIDILREFNSFESQIMQLDIGESMPTRE